MKQEDYVSFDVAKLLREKGYNRPCDSVYIHVSRIKFSGGCVRQDWNHLPMLENANLYTSAPSLWDAQKWLRDKHSITIDIVYGGHGRYCGGVLDMNTDNLKELLDFNDTYEQALNEGIKEALKMI